MIKKFFYLIVLSVLSLVKAEDTNCPCLTTDGGALDVYMVDGQLHYSEYPYPNDYGTRCDFRFKIRMSILICAGTDGCKAYDTDPVALEPYCGNSSGTHDDAPAWCFDSFCYVDPSNCVYRTTLSGVFPDSGAALYSQFGI